MSLVNQRPFAIALTTAALALLAATAMAQQPLPYYCDFEPPDFSVGALGGQGGWVADALSSASITDVSGNVYSGQQAVQLLAGGSADQAFNDSSNMIWIDGWQKGAPSDGLPDLGLLSGGSALVAFTNTTGVLLLDGDGYGSGVWTPSGVTIAGPNTWYRVVLKLDFPSQTYDAWIGAEGSPLTQGGAALGFLTSDTTQLSGFRASAGEDDAFLDRLRISATTPSMELSPTTPFNATGAVGGPFSPDSKVYTITNYSLGDLDWQVTGAPAWLDVSPDSGTGLAVDASADVTVGFSAAANALAEGVYNATISFVGSDFTTVDVDVQLDITNVPEPGKGYKTNGQYWIRLPY